MTKKTSDSKELSQAEMRLIDQLREHPEIMSRVESILALASNAEGPLKTADEVEDLLIQEVRQLGSATMKEWATQAENRVSNELKGQDASVRSRKKNTEVVVCLWTGEGARTDLAQPGQELSAPLAPTLGSDSSRTVATTGAGAHGLWL